MADTLKTKKLLIIADTLDGSISPAAAEMLPLAKRLGLSTDETLMVVPTHTSGEEAEKLCLAGCDVLAIEHDGLRYHNPPLLAHLATRLAKELDARYICLPHTMHGAVAAASIAHALDAPVITAVEDVTLIKDRYTFTRFIMNGKALMRLEPQSETLVLTVQSGSFSKEKPAPADTGRLYVRKADYIESGYTPQGLTGAAESKVRLAEADVVVSAGRGLGAQENLALIREAASLFKNSAVGASRSLCDNGWLPYAHQVGMTGATVSPRLYLACGISGAQQHLVGMKGSQLVVAVNTDQRAHIFSIAHYGIVDDLKEFLPVFIARCRERIFPGEF